MSSKRVLKCFPHEGANTLKFGDVFNQNELPQLVLCNGLAVFNRQALVEADDDSENLTFLGWVTEASEGRCTVDGHVVSLETTTGSKITITREDLDCGLVEVTMVTRTSPDSVATEYFCSGPSGRDVSKVVDVDGCTFEYYHDGTITMVRGGKKIYARGETAEIDGEAVEFEAYDPTGKPPYFDETQWRIYITERKHTRAPPLQQYDVDTEGNAGDEDTGDDAGDEDTGDDTEGEDAGDDTEGEDAGDDTEGEDAGDDTEGDKSSCVVS